VNSNAPPFRLLAAFAALGIAAAAVAGSAGASTVVPTPGALPIPTDTPMVGLANPPLSVAAPLAVDSCANDEFLADRSVPLPWTRAVTICGSVVQPGGRGAAFALNVDGTPPISIVAAGFTAQPGDMVVLRGRYHRSSSGAEWIDGTQRAADGNWAQPAYAVINGTTHQ